MKKVLNKKFSSSSKLVKKVLSRSEIVSSKKKNNNVSCNGDDVDDSSCKGHQSMTVETPSSSHQLLNEIESLKSQITQLKSSINLLETETESKDIKLAVLAREKEKLSLDLLKVKRSNSTLSQQLDDERRFYYKEKETYCQEMNQLKKIKQALSSYSSSSNLNTEIDNAKEIQKLRKALEQALHTNYNLSVKFLKIKDAKSDLKISLQKAREQHKQVVEDLRVKIESLSREMNEILDQKFNAPISPSNRKYLQLVNQNSNLVYENLCLQLQVDQLQLRRNNKIESNNNNNNNNRSSAAVKKKKTRKKNVDDEKLSTKAESNHKIITIFERDKKPKTATGQPTLPPNENKQSCSLDKINVPPQNDSKLTVFQVSAIQSQTSSTVSSVITRKRSRSAPKIIQSVYLRDIYD